MAGSGSGSTSISGSASLSVSGPGVGSGSGCCANSSSAALLRQQRCSGFAAPAPAGMEDAMDEDTQEGTGTEVALPVDRPVDAISAPPVGQQKAARGAMIESELLVRGSAAQHARRARWPPPLTRRSAGDPV